MRFRAILIVGVGALAACSEPVNTPTYYADVAPILQARCTSCHTDGGIAPFTLSS